MKLEGSLFLKDEPHSCLWTPIFFNFFRGFLKWKQLFVIAETYFSISFTRLAQMDFLPSGNSIFCSVLFHYWQKPLLEQGENSFERERPYYCQWTTDFLASGNLFFLHFSETLASDLFSFQWKCILQRNPSFRLVETDLLANGNRFLLSRVFPLSGNCHLNQWKPIFKERLYFN